MTGPGLLDQAIAAFALHVVWQVPLLACTAWMAVRIGRPSVRVAHALWVSTLLLSVCAPLVTTWQGYRVARAQAHASAVSISYSTEDAVQNLPAMQRESVWLRLLHKHVNAVDGVTPFTFALPTRVARGVAVTYMLLLVLACVRFVFAWRRARSLVREASADVPQTFAEAMRAQCWTMDCTAPRTAVSDAIAGPLLAGVMQPTLLLPTEFAAELSDEEVEAVLAHELSHLRRQDPLWHAACSVMLLPVQFHPAAMWIAARIRQTREMACDAEAAQWMGSSSRYADALLCVAERMVFAPAVPVGVGLGLFDVERGDATAVRDGWSWSKPGPATAGLELFGATGAMEERMQSMMNHKGTMSRSSRWTRGLAAAAIAASGVVAACLIQVQPTFAAQQATTQAHADAQLEQQPMEVVTVEHEPALASGRSAEQHLRDANRRLREAEANATTDEDRNKIATAQQVLRMAQAELAAQSGPQPMTVRVVPQRKLDDLHPMDMQLQQLDQQAFQLKLDTQKHVRIQVIQADQQKMQALQKQFNSRDQQMRLQKQAMDQIRVQVDTQIQDRVKDARRFAKDSILIAKLEPPVILVEPQEAPKTAKVSAGVMAGQIVNKPVPVYPQSAKEAKISGSVVLHAIIDETGKVESLAVISSPDKDLSRSAIDTVQHWTYKPYLLNGKPTAVDTTVTVNYTFGG